MWKLRKADSCCGCGDARPDDSRRDFLGSLAALAASATLALRGREARAAEDARKAPPQVGDYLTYDAKAKRGPHLAPGDLEIGAKQLVVVAVDPASGVVRDGSRFNKIMLTRLDPAKLTPETASRAAEGVVAYSSICTHDGCAVSSWDDKEFHYVCPCHQSIFDPKAGGVLVSMFLTFNANIGVVFTMKALIVVIMGGVGNLLGCLVAGLILGLAETFVATFVDPGLTLATTYALFLTILLVRPQGLFGTSSR